MHFTFETFTVNIYLCSIKNIFFQEIYTHSISSLADMLKQIFPLIWFATWSIAQLNSKCNYIYDWIQERSPGMQQLTQYSV